MTDHAQSSPETLLNLAAVARMLHADYAIAEEEVELFAALLEAGGLDEEARRAAAGWAERPPGPELLGELGGRVDTEARLEALALAWVTAHADGEVAVEEVDEHALQARCLGLDGRAEGVRRSVEAEFFGSALTVLATLAAACRMATPRGAGRALYAEAVDEMDLPEEISGEARGWFDAPRPLHQVLTETSTLAPDFQEALLGQLWSLTVALGKSPAVGVFFARFERACGVSAERVGEIKAEWADEEEG